MDIETVRAFLGWCAVVNGGLLIVSFLVCALAGDWVYRMHGKWFPMPRETFNTAIYCFIGGMKILVLMFNIVPYLALVILS